MSGYTKLFARILDSTVWRESDPTRLLWITMLALADKEGNVYCTIPGLADRARITLIECEKGLEKFQSPDKYSWSQEDEGRRIRPITGGWFLINHEKFRNMMSREQQREKTRIRVSNWREKKKTEASVTVTKSNASNDIASTEATTNKILEPSLNLPLENSEPVASAPKRNSRGERLPEDFIPWPEHYALAKELGLNVEMEFQKFRDYWLGASGEKARKCDWPATLRNWLRNSAERKESRNGRYEANGPELTKTQQRVINNRNAILAGFDVDPHAGHNEPSVQDRGNARGGESLETRFLKGKT